MRVGFDDQRQRDVYRALQDARHMRIVRALAQAGYAVAPGLGWPRMIVPMGGGL